MKLPRAFYEAVATLTGCIIGAGILGIPYVVVRSGFWTGMLVIIGLGLASLLIHLLTGEVALRSKTCHQLVGYATKYLGKPGKYLMTASMIIGVYGALIAYTLGTSESLSALFGGPVWMWAVIFYALMSALIYGGIQMLEKSELWMEGLKFVVFIAILVVLFSSKYFSSARFVGFAWEKLLIPYGVVLFAYAGTAAIPEVREELQKCKLLTRNAIIWGSVIPMITYALFAIAVVGVTGGLTTEVATIGIAKATGGFTFILLHVFAILAMATSFIALGYALKDMYHLDFKLPHGESWILTIAIPALLIGVGIHSFVDTLQVAGVFAGGLAGITIVLMHAKARKRSERKPEYQIKMNWLVYGVLIALFAIGMLFELSLLL